MQQLRRNLIGQNVHQQLKTLALLEGVGWRRMPGQEVVNTNYNRILNINEWQNKLWGYIYETGREYCSTGPSFYIQQIWCRKSDCLRTVNCTISLYKCSVITFSTVRDQPVTSVEKKATNDSPGTFTDPTNILSFTLRHRSPIGNQCVEVDKVLCLSPGCTSHQ